MTEAERKRRRDDAVRRRQRNRGGGRCINDTIAGTHGPATRGVRCAHCAAVHTGSRNVADPSDLHSDADHLAVNVPPIGWSVEADRREEFAAESELFRSFK